MQMRIGPSEGCLDDFVQLGEVQVERKQEPTPDRRVDVLKADLGLDQIWSKGDRSVESLEVKAPEGRPKYRSDPCRGASKRAGRSDCANQVATKFTSRAKRIAGFWECRAGLFAAKAMSTPLLWN